MKKPIQTILKPTPTELLAAALRCFAPYRGHNARTCVLVIANKQLICIPAKNETNQHIFIMGVTKRMLQEGLTSDQLDHLQKKLIKYQKEITN